MSPYTQATLRRIVESATSSGRSNRTAEQAALLYVIFAPVVLR